MSGQMRSQMSKQRKRQMSGGRLVCKHAQSSAKRCVKESFRKAEGKVMCKLVESVQRLCGLSELSVRTAGKYNRKNGKQTCDIVQRGYDLCEPKSEPNKDGYERCQNDRNAEFNAKLSARAAMIKLVSKADGIIRHAVVDVGFEVAGAALKSKSSNTQQQPTVTRNRECLRAARLAGLSSMDSSIFCAAPGANATTIKQNQTSSNNSNDQHTKYELK